MIYDFDFRFIIHKSKIITFVSDYKNKELKSRIKTLIFLFLIFNS